MSLSLPYGGESRNSDLLTLLNACLNTIGAVLGNSTGSALTERAHPAGHEITVRRFSLSHETDKQCPTLCRQREEEGERREMERGRIEREIYKETGRDYSIEKLVGM